MVIGSDRGSEDPDDPPPELKEHPPYHIPGEFSKFAGALCARILLGSLTVPRPLAIIVKTNEKGVSKEGGLS